MWAVVSLCSHFGGFQGCRVKVLTVRKQLVLHASELSRQCWVSSSAVWMGFVSLSFLLVSAPNFGEGCLSVENGDLTHVDAEGMTDLRLHASFWQQPFTASVAYASSGKRRKSPRGQCREQVRKQPSTNETGRSHKRGYMKRRGESTPDALEREWKDTSSLDRTLTGMERLYEELRKLS